MKMFFINLILNCIKYIFFYNYYTVIIFCEEKDYRANPEPGEQNQNKSSIEYSKK